MLTSKFAAGFFDADGSANIQWSKAHNRFCLQLQVINTNQSVVHAFHETYGGHVYRKSSKAANDRTCWVWEIGGYKGREFLMAVTPYLIVKKTRAWIALHMPVGKQGRRISPLTKVGQAAGYAAMRILNSKGQRATSLGAIEPALAAHAALKGA